MTPQEQSKCELLEAVQRLKQNDRKLLFEMQPDEAQAEAQAVLDPAIGCVLDIAELAWPGDLADDWEPRRD